MSTVPASRPHPSDTPPPEDPYRYGWRYHKVIDPDGTEHFKTIPLTLEDVHHPQEEDYIAQREGHAEDRFYLYGVLKVHLGERALVTCDLRIAWDIPEVGALGPDVTVIFGGTPDRNRGTFDVAEEGLRPTVVFEVVSPHTRVNDIGPKVQEYRLGGVEWYIIIDALGIRDGRWDLRVVAYRLWDGDYVTASLDDAGRLWVEPLGVYVSVRDGRVVCYDAAGAALLNFTELSQARAEAVQARQIAEEQQATEKSQREAAEQARRLAEQAQQLAEQQRKDAEQAQKLAEQQRKDAEQAQKLAEQQRESEQRQREAAEQAAADLAERVRQLEDEMRRLRGEGT